MLAGLLKSNFYSKCKSQMRMTKARLDMLKKKKSSVVKFLKNDMADLLRSGLDYNAYCRAEGLLVEQHMLACFNFIEQFCGCISTNLSAMSKQSECPEECREAVQSLIYAAARIPEFPELRDLRTLFTQRYGGHLESFINKQFVEILRPKTTTKEMKLQLMHDISEEFSIEWNSKSLEQELFKPPLEDQNSHFTSYKDDIFPKDCRGDDEDHDFTKKTNHETWKKVNDSLEDTLLRKEKAQLASRGRKNAIDEGYNLPCRRRICSDLASLQATSSPVGSVSEDEEDRKKPFYYGLVAPPYVKPKVEKEESKLEEPAKPTGNVLAEDDLISEAKLKPRSVRRRPLKQPPGHDNFGIVERPLKPPPGHEKLFRPENGGLTVAKSNPSMGKEDGANSRISQGDDINLKDEEEKIIDKHLMHYCKDSVKPCVNSPTNLKSTKSELNFPSGGEAYEASPQKAVKRHNRVVSLQPENRHVHPNLPDYEDLAARFAALKRR